MSTERDDDTDQTAEPPESPAADHPRGRSARRSRLTVVAVAAAVLLAGGGGAYWATAGGPGGDSAAGKSAPPRLMLDGPHPGVYETGPAGGATYQLTGTLPKGPNTAPVYAAKAVDKAAVARLGAAFGLTGPVTSPDKGTWRVGGTGDGGGPVLEVGKDAPGTWSYALLGPWTKSAPGADSSVGGGPTLRTAQGDTGTDVTPPSRAGGPPLPTGVPPISEQRAKAVAAPVLAKLGLSGARIDASQAVGAMRLVTADPVVGGLPTHGWTTTVQVGSDGVITLGYGRLSSFDKGASYPLVGAAQALRELNSHSLGLPAEGLTSCLVPVPKPRPEPNLQQQGGKQDSPSAEPTVPGQDKTLPRTRPCVPGNGHPVQVRGATFGLTLEFVSSTQTLVPAWLFDTAQAGVAHTSVVAQPAVDPAYLQGVPPPLNPGGPMVPAQPVQPTSPASPLPPSPAPTDPGGPVAGNRVAVTAYHASGTTLTVTFWGGLCSDYQASAQETASRVRVSVTATPKGGKARMCPMIARSFSKQIKLAQPLGTRTVVDASTGQPVKAVAR